MDSALVPDGPLISLAVALGIGLLIGAERERRKRGASAPQAAGIRTFAITSLAGAVSLLFGSVAILAVTAVVTGVLATVSYWLTQQDDDPGITTEVALVLTVLLGGLATRQPALAAMIGVAVAVLLAARTPLHHFVTSVLTEREVNDALVLAGAALVVLPLLPDRAIGPFDAINPRSIWIVVVLVLSIGAAGHVAVRALGMRFGLPLAGFASGFVSSAATIGAMGERARKAPDALSATVAGAVLSTVATFAQMAVVIAATSLPTLESMTAPLVCGGLVAAAYGAAFTVRALRQPTPKAADAQGAFSLASALGFALTLAVVLMLSAALREWFGETGAVVAAAAAGLVDAHAAAISIAAMVASGAMLPGDSVAPILAGLSTNTATKILFAATGGGPRFGLRVVPGLLLALAAAWAGALLRIG